MVFLFFTAGIIYAQSTETEEPGISRSLIPEELLRPRREEDPRYPVDMVIGPLGQGEISGEAYQFAREAATALRAGNKNAASLSAMNTVLLESCLSTLDQVSPRSFRLGSGREEPDGSYSFLIRFIGREQGITGELYIRHEEQPPARTAPAQAAAAEPAEQADTADIAAADTAATENTENERETPAAAEAIPVKMVWVFEDLILEEARDREIENKESRHQFDFSPYERFF
ncbi:MAG: hypothetical protein LBH97_00840 [Treponema sp.]|jgi:hypothetical protein|nr:hypothetical protein [Treponema sp.]